MKKPPDTANAASSTTDSSLATGHKSKPSLDSLLHLFVIIPATAVMLLYVVTLICSDRVEVQEIEHDLLARTYINAIPRRIVRNHSP